MFKKDIDVFDNIVGSLASNGAISKELYEYALTALKNKVEESSDSNKPEDKLLTRHETAEYLRCSLRTVDHLLADGNLPCVRFGLRSVRIRKSDLDSMLAGGAV